MDLEHEGRLTRVEDRAKSNTHRIEKLEKSTEAINKLATSMEVMATKQEEVAENVGKLTAKVTEIEHRPAKRWDRIVDKILTTITGAILLYILARLGF